MFRLAATLDVVVPRQKLVGVLACVTPLLAATSSHAQFDTIINVPPDPALTAIGSNTQFNLFDGGSLPSSHDVPFLAGLADGSSSNVEVNIMGGEVGNRFQANSGSRVNISGGRVGAGFRANDGSRVEILGGAFGHGFNARDGSQVTISGGTFGHLFFRGDVTFSGGEFLLNGVPLESSVVTLADDDILTGTFEDGSPFIFSPLDGDSLNDVTLVETALPPPDTTPIFVDGNNAPPGLRASQTLTLVEGGSLRNNFAAVGATLHIDGGNVLAELEIADSVLDISGGFVDHLDAFAGGQVNITGGTVRWLTAHEESSVNISGGTFGRHFSTYAGQVTISGGEFRLNGVPIDGLTNVGDTITVDLPEESLLSGILADGTPFAISSQLFDASFALVPIDNVANALTLQSTSLPPNGPAVITASENPIPQGIRGGQTLVVDAGSVIGDDFRAGPGSRIVVQEGGTIGDHLRAVGATIEVAGGTVGTSRTGGYSGLWAFAGTRLMVSGGDVHGVRLLAGSQMHLMGTQFFVDGVPLSGLSLGEAFTVDDRGGPFTGRLADGSDFTLYSSDVSPDATLTFTLVALLEGDYNFNGTVDQGDLDLVLRNWGDELFNPVAAGWFNDLPDGRIDQSELDAVLTNWGNSVATLGTAGAPEPGSLLLLGIAVASLGVRRCVKRKSTDQLP